ncbi:MAG TPA: HNH endonuclease signature motif containing protein [Gemmataceae bacterium]|nr:HNH endonuclease signature motif containing protein [Gemmataceae bacterium]
MARNFTEIVWDRAHGSCEYCKMPQESDELTFEVEHIISKKHGGKTTLSNTCLACFGCNRYKGSDIAGRDDKTGKLVSLFNPRRMNWTRHFRWDGPRLIGRSAIGRVTVKILGINLAHRVEFRQELIDANLFFPDT